MPTTHPRRLLAIAGTALLALAAAGTPAASARSKPAGPALTLESKICNTGATVEQRSVVLTASAVLRGVGTGVQMRFSVQQRATTKTTWRTVFAKTGDLGTWATSDAGADGLRYTKTINGLAEGSQYRVNVDARGINSAGKVVTKVTRKSYLCAQPQFSAHLVFANIAWTTAKAATGAGDETPMLAVTVRNVGRQVSVPSTISFTDTSTGTLLSEAGIDPLAGGKSRKAVYAATCGVPLELTLKATDAADAAVAPDVVTATVPPCPGAATKSAKRR